jgi:Tfp pilus assembly protein PilO
MAMFSIKNFTAFLAKMSKREKTVFYAATFFISLTVLDRLIISPISDKIRMLDKEIEDKEAAVRKNLRILNYKDRIMADKTKYRGYLHSTKSDEEEMTQVLKEIESLAESSQIYLIDMKPGEVQEMGTSKKYSVNLNCEAQMEQLVTFMYSVEDSKRLLTIEKFQVAPKSKESTLARCRITITKLALL